MSDAQPKPLRPSIKPTSAAMMPDTVRWCRGCSKWSKQLFQELTTFTRPSNPFVTVSQSYLARRMSLARQTINRHMAELINCGHVAIKKQGREGFPATYHIHFGAPVNRRPLEQLWQDVDDRRRVHEPSGRREHERRAAMRGEARRIVHELADLMAISDPQASRAAKLAAAAELKRRIELHGEAAVLTDLCLERERLAERQAHHQSVAQLTTAVASAGSGRASRRPPGWVAERSAQPEE